MTTKRIILPLFCLLLMVPQAKGQNRTGTPYTRAEMDSCYRNLTNSLTDQDLESALQYGERLIEMKRSAGEQDFEYAVALNTKGYILEEHRQDNEAILYLEEGIAILKKVEETEGTSYTTALLSLGKAYGQTGQYDRAFDVISEGYNILWAQKQSSEELDQISSALYFDLSSCMVYVCFNTGRYLEALRYGFQCLEELESCNLPDKYRIYPLVHLNMGNCYMRLGDYQSSLGSYQKATYEMENCGMDRSIEYVSVLNDIALLYMMSGDPQCIAIENKAFDLAADIGLGTDDRIYYMMMQNMSLMAVMFNGYFENPSQAADTAERFLWENLREIEKRNGKESVTYAEALNDLGWLYYDLRKDYQSAAECFYDSATKYEKKDMITNLAYLNSIVNLTMSMYRAGYDITKVIPPTLRAFYLYIVNNFITAPELIRKMSDYSLSIINSCFFASREKEGNTENDRVLYNWLLVSKGLEVGTSTDINQTVQRYGNTEVKSEWEELKSLKQRLDQANASFNENDRALRDSLKSLIIAKENYFLSQFSDLASESKYLDAGWEYLASRLGENDTAIEFLDFERPETDSVPERRYAAMIVRKGWKAPVYIPLFGEGELKRLTDDKTPEAVYSTEGNGNALFKLIWERLLPYISPKGDTYFSPTGDLWTMPVENIPHPSGIPMSTKYRLHRVSSTKAPLFARHQDKYRSALLYGGLDYGGNNPEGISEDRAMTQYMRGGSAKASRESAAVTDTVTRAGWSYLPGTLEEAEKSGEIFRKHGMSASVLSGIRGTEESVKALSGKSPDILHIATHGFFLSNDISSGTKLFSSLQEADGGWIDPLLRSGLIMSGGNPAWKSGKAPEDADDGILTAMELMSLDFSHTDLVVLSACYTGLGDTGWQGIYGLQRAFKNAGVQTVIMSLWKVSDTATSLMMSTFYSKLMSGASKDEAFRKARETVRKKYESPYYWASFIMLD